MKEILEIPVAVFAIVGVIFGICEFILPCYILDSDHDGVHNCYDACEKPECSIIDSSGCPKDSDADSVGDCDDACPLQEGDIASGGCPTLGGSAIIFYFVNYDAEGNDNVNVNGEWVEIHNIGDQDTDMTGWKLRDESGHVFDFPYGFVLKAGELVRIYTGKGENTASELYSGYSKAIWDNDRDCARLVDNLGNEVDVKCWQN